MSAVLSICIAIRRQKQGVETLLKGPGAIQAGLLDGTMKRYIYRPEDRFENKNDN